MMTQGSNFEHIFIRVCTASIPYLTYRFDVALSLNDYENAICEVQGIKTLCDRVLSECRRLKKGGN